jgi:hypothetical protein
MSQISLRRTIPHLGPLQIAIILLALVTGLVHLDRGLLMTFLAGPRPGHLPGSPLGHFPGSPPGSFGGPSPLMQLVFTALPVLFYLNFFGYVILAGALYLPALVRYQRIIRWILIFYTAITILAWFLITNGHLILLSYIDKPIEVALIILLLIDDRQAQASKG